MGCDMVVALGQATVDRQTLFGHNCDQPVGRHPRLRLRPAKAFAAGEKTRTQYLELPQARNVHRTLGVQPDGAWGYCHGVNEHGLAAGCTALRTRIRHARPGLLGTDLVRLGLERATRARQAVELITDLIERQGQGGPGGNGDGEEGERDHALLVADAAEAFLVEAAGPYWVLQEIHAVRAAGNLCTVRQDWDRISRGLAGYAIDQGWWPGDGNKLDFTAALADTTAGEDSALRRWGRATLLLESQSGHIDTAFVRRLLGDHYEGTHFEIDPCLPGGPTPLCRHARHARDRQTAASLVAPLGQGAGRLQVAWCAFGPPCATVFFPLFLDGDLPAAFDADGGEAHGAASSQRVAGLALSLGQAPDRWAFARDLFGRLQSRFDQDAEEFLGEGAALRQAGSLDQLRRRATLLMQHHLEQFEKAAAEIDTRREPAHASSAQPMSVR